MHGGENRNSTKLTVSVSDLIADLPSCSPLIPDVTDRGRGHRMVLQALTQVTRCTVEIPCNVESLTGKHKVFPWSESGNRYQKGLVEAAQRKLDNRKKEQKK